MYQKKVKVTYNLERSEYNVHKHKLIGRKYILSGCGTFGISTTTISLHPSGISPQQEITHLL